MTEASRVQKMLTEQNAEIDRLNRHIEQLEAALKKIAKHDMQAIAMDALRPDGRVRKALEGEQ